MKLYFFLVKIVLLFFARKLIYHLKNCTCVHSNAFIFLRRSLFRQPNRFVIQGTKYISTRIKREKNGSRIKKVCGVMTSFLSEFKSRDCSFELIIFPNGHHFSCFYLADTSVAPTLSQTSLTSFINNVIEYTSEGGSLDCF